MVRFALALAVVLVSQLAVAAPPPDAAVLPESATTAPTKLELERQQEAERRRLEAIAREYERISETPPEAFDREPGASLPRERTLLGAIVQTVFVLGAVVLLAYLTLGKLLPRLMRIEQPVAQRRIMQVIDRLPLDQRRAIMVIRIGELYYLVGASENGINLISRLDGDDVEDALQSATHVSPPTLGKLASVLSKKPR
jgi:flagellar biogenesis protein FliO